ncbi:guanylyl cyclase, putative, partial [Plasmodium ovale curtisi]
MRATVVLFCKLKNTTKGKIINKLLSATNPRLTILGVGSTLNDAHLLKNATISVCLSSNERTDVLYSISDYVLQEFKYISDLLIIGRLNRFSLWAFLWIIYLKITIVSLYFFHNFDNFFSGSSNSSILYSQTTFAIFHYLLIVAFSAYEIDLPYKFIRHVPYLYQMARRKYFLNNTIIFLTILEAVLISVISLFNMEDIYFWISLLPILYINFCIHKAIQFVSGRIYPDISAHFREFANLHRSNEQKGEEVEQKWEEVEQKWEEVEQKWEEVEQKGEEVEQKWEEVEQKGEEVEQKWEEVEQKGEEEDVEQKWEEDVEKKRRNENDKLNFYTDEQLQKMVPIPKIYSIKNDKRKNEKSRKTKFFYDKFKKIVDIKIKYRNQ